MISLLITGTILGLSAGFAPGPLLTLVISETLLHGIKAGIKVSLAPIITDLPIIIFTLFILAKLAHFHHILGFISISGAFFIIYLGIKYINAEGVNIAENRASPKSLQKGILVNVLSPHPYLFWFSVGGPTTVRALNKGLPAALSFIVSFYVLLVGSKIILALLTEKSRSFLQGKAYVFTMRLLGFILIILAGFLFHDGIHLLGLV